MKSIKPKLRYRGRIDNYLYLASLIRYKGMDKGVAYDLRLHFRNLYRHVKKGRFIKRNDLYIFDNWGQIRLY